MTIDFCGTCGELRWDNKHQCSPAWYVEFVDEDFEDGESRRQVHSRSAGGAAETFVENWDIEWALEGPSSELKVRVKLVTSDDSGEWQIFNVQGEMVPQYHAREVKE